MVEGFLYNPIWTCQEANIKNCVACVGDPCMAEVLMGFVIDG